MGTARPRRLHVRAARASAGSLRRVVGARHLRRGGAARRSGQVQHRAGEQRAPMIAALPPAQVAVLDAALGVHGLTSTLHALAQLVQARARRLGAGEGAAVTAERWEAFAERIDELAYGLTEADDEGQPRWRTPLWSPVKRG